MIFNLLENKPFNDVFNLLTNLPYNFKISHSNNLYIIKIPKIYRYKNNENSDVNNIIKECNGLILEKNTNKIVCYCENNILELNNDELKQQLKNNIINNNNIYIEKANDGVSIRLYYYDNKWNIATKKYINAHESKWNNNKSFGALFDDFNFDYSKLSKNCCYYYIMQHPDFRNIVKITEKNLILKNIYNLDINNYEKINKEIIEIKDDINIEMYFNNLIDMPPENIGYIIYSNSNFYYLLCDKYKELTKIRMNSKNFMYKNIILNKYGNKLQYITYFPEDLNNLNECNSIYIEIVNKIQNLYYQKYISKNSIFINPLLNTILNHLHHDYYNTKIPTTAVSVYNKLNEYSPKRIYQIVKIFTNR